MHGYEEKQDEEADGYDGGRVGCYSGESVEEGVEEGLGLDAERGELLQDGAEVGGEGCVEGGELGGVILEYIHYVEVCRVAISEREEALTR